MIEFKTHIEKGYSINLSGQGVQAYLKHIYEKGQAVIVSIKPFRKKRSTGKKSQNHHLNGHIQQISQETGEEFDRVKYYVKQKAIKYGYPIRSDLFGKAIPISEADCNTLECGYLIDAVHEMAAFLDIELMETEE